MNNQSDHPRAYQVLLISFHWWQRTGKQNSYSLLVKGKRIEKTIYYLM